MPQRHISINSMMCTHCGKCFFGRSIKNKKKVICKICKKEKQNYYTVVELYLFLRKLFVYEPGLYQKIKMFKIPVFHTETFYNENRNDKPIISNISNYYKLSNPHFRYTNRILKYLQRNKDRLKLRHCLYYKKNQIILLIHYQTIPLCYLPYIYIEVSTGEIQSYENVVYNYSNYEMINIDYDIYELDETRKLLKDLKLQFNMKTGSIQSLTYNPF